MPNLASDRVITEALLRRSAHPDAMVADHIVLALREAVKFAYTERVVMDWSSLDLKIEPTALSGVGPCVRVRLTCSAEPTPERGILALLAALVRKAERDRG